MATKQSNDIAGWLAFLVLILFVGAIISGIALIHAAVTSRPPVTIPDTATSLALRGQPGQTLDFALSGTSISGYWATDGLTLALRGGGRFQVATPKAAHWGSSIGCGTNGSGCSDGGFTVPAQFTVPARYSAGDVLTGRLTGDISYPTSSGQAGTFSNANDSVDAAVRVQVTATASTGVQHETWGLGWAGWLAVFGGDLVVLLTVAGISSRGTRPSPASRHRDTPARRPTAPHGSR